jgi:hypothetical protein
MPESSRVIEQAEALLRRVSPEGRRLAMRARQRRWQTFVRRLGRAALAMLAIAFAAAMVGLLVTPLGIEGLLLSFVAMALAAGIILFWPSGPEPTPETLVRADLAALPLRTEEWLERQRPALPAPAARLVDGIGLRLEALAPQLQGLDPREPAAVEIRKLIGEELPELIDGYRRVPAGLRREVRNGMSPDKQLTDGLAVVESEIGRMTEQLASGDLHKLATQGRYLELKYRGEDS